MDVEYDGQTAFDAAANGDFPLVVLLWGMSMAVHPQPVDLLAVKDSGGNTLVHYAAASCEDTCDTLHFLMQQMHVSGREEALMDARNDAGETPLTRAAHAGNLLLAGALLHSGFVDILAQDARGNTPAHHAAAEGHLWMLHFLLEAEQRHNMVSTNGEKAKKSTTLGGYSLKRQNVLFYACMSESKPTVQYALTRGFDANEMDAEGKKCLDIAKQRNLLWLEDLLSDKAKTADPPTHLRQTRRIVAVVQGVLLLFVLATAYWLVWWLALPFIVIVLSILLLAFRQHGQDRSLSGHSHEAASSALGNVHPSKKNAVVAKNVSLEQVEVGLLKDVSARSKKSSVKLRVGIRTFVSAQPESMMGIWIAWLGVFILMYVMLWVDPCYKDFRNSYAFFLAITGGIKAVFVIVWARLAFICPNDPGTLKTYDRDVKAMLEKASRCEVPDMTKFCRTCLIMKPIRSKHCAQCNICVARHDHHCAWINRCVGFGNHRFFFAFLILHCIALGLYAVLCTLVLHDATHNLHAKRVDTAGSGDRENLSTFDVWIEIPSLLKNHLLVIIVLLWDVMAFFALALMVTQHLNNIEHNLTINERMNWRRYAYLNPKLENNKKPSPEAISNPFDHGMKNNVAEFFIRSGRFAVNYRNLFTIPNSSLNLTSPASSEVSAKSEYVSEEADYVV